MLNNLSFYFKTLLHLSLLALFFLATPIGAAEKHSHIHALNAQQMPESLGLHGMLLFGSEDGLFASHLPMFHAPHNAQVVFKLSLEDKAVEAWVVDELTKADALPYWTIIPQTMDLVKLNPAHPEAINRFTADIASGHFERGGVTQRTQQTINIEQMLIFKVLPLKHNIEKPNQLTYQLVRSGAGDTTQFLVKTLNARPDADHVLKLSQIEQPLGEEIIPIAGSELHATNQQLIKQLKPLAPKVQLTPIYLELNELK